MVTASAPAPASSPRPSKRITNRFRIAAVLGRAGPLCVETGDGVITRFASARVDEGTLTLVSPSSPCPPAQLVTLSFVSAGLQLFGCARVLSGSASELVTALPPALIQVRERGVSAAREGIECASTVPSARVAEFFKEELVTQPVVPGKSFVLLQDGELCGHVTGLRVFSRTWVTQHLLVKTGLPRAVQSSQRLLAQSFEFGESLADIEYIRGVWRGGERLLAGISERFFRRGLAYRFRYQPMRLGRGRPLRPTRLPVRLGGPEDELAFLQHVARSEDPVKLLSDDLVPGRFATRGRALVAVDDRRGQTLGWALLERSCFRIFLLEPSGALADEARRSLASSAPHSECHAAPSDVAVLQALGFVSQAPRYEFGAHRSVARELTRQMGAILAHAGKRPSEAGLVSQFC